ncbi:MAG: PAS domain-containing protein, partial [Deinococcota bacterium]
MAERNLSSSSNTSSSQDALAKRVEQLEAQLIACQKQSQGLRTSLTSVLKHHFSATAIFDTDMRYVAANDKWVQDYGLEQHNIIGKSHYDIFPDISDAWKDVHKRCLAGHSESQQQDPYPRADGSLMWLDWSVYPWLDLDGDIAGIVINTEVVSGRVQAQEEARVFRKLVEASSDGVVISDLNNTITYANSAYQAMVGAPDSDLIGQSLVPYMGTGYNLDDVNDTTRKQGEWHGVIDHKQASGDTFLAKVVSFAMRDSTGALTQRASICRDVTDEQRLRRSLVDNEQHLQMLLIGLPIMLFATDLAGTITLSEGRDLTYLGVQPGEAVGQSIFTFYQDMPELLTNVERALNGESLSFEVYYPDSQQHFERYFAPLKDSSGTITGMMGLAFNITERKQSEVALENERRRLLALNQAVPDLIMRFDRQGTYLDYKPASYFRSYASPEEIIGKTLEEAAPADIAQKRRKLIAVVLDTGEMQTNESSLVIDGETRYRENRLVKLNDNEVLVFVRDITDLKQAEAALRESQRLLEDAQSIGKLGGWSFDIASQEISWSKQIYDTMEAPYNSELTTPFLMSFYKDTTALQNAMTGAVNNREAYDLELEITTLKGNHRWVRAIGRPVVEDGKVIKLVGTQQDITDIKQIEIELLDSRQFLEDAQSMAQVGGWSFDVALQRSVWSKQVYDTMEAPYDREPTLSFVLSFHKDKDTLNALVTRAIEHAEPYDLEHEIVTFKGKHRWIRTICKPIVEDGKVVKLIGSQQDITDIKQVETQLLESQQFLEDAQSMGKMGGWSFDLITQELYWSKQIYDISEVPYDTELSVELAVSVYVDPAAIEAAMANTIETHEPYDVELEIIMLKGNYRWVRSIGKPVVEDGQVVKLLGTHQDITDMKQAELGLQIANDNLARLNTLSERLNQVESLSEMLEVVLAPLPEDTLASTLYSIYEDDKLVAFEQIASVTPDNFPPIEQGVRYPISAFPSIDLWHNGDDNVLVIDNIATDTRLDKNIRDLHLQLGLGAMVFIGLVQADKLVSLVGLYWLKPRHFSAQDIDYFKALSSLLAPITVNRQLLANLEKTVTTRTQELQTQLTETLRFRALFESSPDIVGY